MAGADDASQSLMAVTARLDWVTSAEAQIAYMDAACIAWHRVASEADPIRRAWLFDAQGLLPMSDNTAALMYMQFTLQQRGPLKAFHTRVRFDVGRASERGVVDELLVLATNKLLIAANAQLTQATNYYTACFAPPIIVDAHHPE